MATIPAAAIRDRLARRLAEEEPRLGFADGRGAT
jgi:hypothetical protein